MISPLGQVKIIVGAKKGEEERGRGRRCVFKAGLKLFFIISHIITKGCLLNTHTYFTQNMLKFKDIIHQ